MKQCRAACKQMLPLSAFGVNAKYKDGRSNYCRECNRKKSEAQRAGWITTPIKKRKISVEQMRLPLDELVLYAIRSGANTKCAIARKVNQHPDVVDIVLVELILDRKQVVTKAEGETRLYFARRAA